MLAVVLGAGLLARSGAFTVLKALGDRVIAAQHREARSKACLAAAFEAIDRGDERRAIEDCVSVLVHSRDEGIRREAVRVLAYAYATSGAWDGLMCLLEEGGASMIAREDLARYAHAARELGHEEDADRIAALAEMPCAAVPLRPAR